MAVDAPVTSSKPRTTAALDNIIDNNPATNTLAACCDQPGSKDCCNKLTDLMKLSIEGNGAELLKGLKAFAVANSLDNKEMMRLSKSLREGIPKIPPGADGELKNKLIAESMGKILKEFKPAEVLPIDSKPKDPTGTPTQPSRSQATANSASITQPGSAQPVVPTNESRGAVSPVNKPAQQGTGPNKPPEASPGEVILAEAATNVKPTSSTTELKAIEVSQDKKTQEISAFDPTLNISASEKTILEPAKGPIAESSHQDSSGVTTSKSQSANSPEVKAAEELIQVAGIIKVNDVVSKAWGSDAANSTSVAVLTSPVNIVQSSAETNYGIPGDRHTNTSSKLAEPIVEVKLNAISPGIIERSTDSYKNIVTGEAKSVQQPAISQLKIMESPVSQNVAHQTINDRLVRDSVATPHRPDSAKSSVVLNRANNEPVTLRGEGAVQINGGDRVSLLGPSTSQLKAVSLIQPLVDRGMTKNASVKSEVTAGDNTSRDPTIQMQASLKSTQEVGRATQILNKIYIRISGNEVREQQATSKGNLARPSIKEVVAVQIKASAANVISAIQRLRSRPAAGVATATAVLGDRRLTQGKKSLQELVGNVREKVKAIKDSIATLFKKGESRESSVKVATVKGLGASVMIEAIKAERPTKVNTGKDVALKTDIGQKMLNVEKYLANLTGKYATQYLPKYLSADVIQQLRKLNVKLTQLLKTGKVSEIQCEALLAEMRMLLESSQTRKLRTVKKGRFTTYSSSDNSEEVVSASKNKTEDEVGFGLQLEEEVDIAQEQQIKLEADAEPQQEMMLSSSTEGPKSELDIMQVLLDNDHLKRKTRLQKKRTKETVTAA